jgi:hypothetical protein
LAYHVNTYDKSGTRAAAVDAPGSARFAPQLEAAGLQQLHVAVGHQFHIGGQPLQAVRQLLARLVALVDLAQIAPLHRQVGRAINRVLLLQLHHGRHRCGPGQRQLRVIDHGGHDGVVAHLEIRLAEWRERHAEFAVGHDVETPC